MRRTSGLVHRTGHRDPEDPLSAAVPEAACSRPFPGKRKRRRASRPAGSPWLLHPDPIRMIRQLLRIHRPPGVVSGGLFLCAVLSTIGFLSLNWSQGLWQIKHQTRALSSLEELPIMIPSASKRTASMFHLPQEVVTGTGDGYKVDFGGLIIQSLEEDGASRVIYHDRSQDEGDVRDLDYLDDDVDGYYGFDDDILRNPYLAFEDDEIESQYQGNCRRPNWFRLQFPVCNIMHEMDLVSNVPQYLSYGAYREVFKVENYVLGQPEKIIWKELRFDKTHTYDNFEFLRMDAHISERFSSNPRIVDIYGFCGMSLLAEFFPSGDIEDLLVPETGYIPAEDVRDDNDVHPKNDIVARDKLLMALEMAEAIAVLHGYEGGVVVHDDIQPSQFFISEAGQLKLNDFNRAEPMLWDDENQVYCSYLNGKGNGNYRAPEEYKDKPLNEQIDIFSLGNIMYSLLTGLEVFDQYDDTLKIQEQIVRGETAFIDERYRTRSLAESKLVEIIERCWEYNPDDRPSIFTIVKFLRRALDEVEERSAST